MLPELDRFNLSFQTTSAETYICARSHLITGVSYGRKIDYDVPLANGMLLQRPLVWSPFQKSEWVWSLLYGRPTPPVAINKTDEAYEVIDGKQRMHTIGEFLRDEFPLLHGEDQHYFSELPEEYQDRILHDRPILGYCAFDLSDTEKLQWFKWINYAGTPQDRDHIRKIEALLEG